MSRARGEPTAAEVRRLVRVARAARPRAYAPYSHVRVGAAVLTPTGAIIQGCNVENASYGLSICAERAAIHCAVAGGHRRLHAVAVATAPSVFMPCGACRQVMQEFGVRFVIVTGDRGGARTLRLAELLGHPFGPADLRQPSGSGRPQQPKILS